MRQQKIAIAFAVLSLGSLSIGCAKFTTPPANCGSVDVSAPTAETSRAVGCFMDYHFGAHVKITVKEPIGGVPTTTTYETVSGHTLRWTIVTGTGLPKIVDCTNGGQVILDGSTGRALVRDCGKPI